MSSFFDKTRSQTKWASISMCFVLAWKTGIEAGKEMNNSVSSECIQISLEVTKASDLYSASVLERATTFCFLEDQLTKLEPKYTR